MGYVRTDRAMQKVKRYGLPYKGSKNSIADWLIDNLPPAEHFYDLFCGGCAVTHAAMVHQKFKYYHVNDILADVPQLFVDACNGKYRNETRWISREDLFALKDTDTYVRLCWSFGNDQRTYMYSKEIEPWKKALHYARVFGDNSLLREMGIQSDGSRKDIEMHYEEYMWKYCEWYGENVNISDAKHIGELQRLQSLESLQRLQSLESLQRLQSLEVTAKDYADIEILQNSVVYCDIPYKGTNGYGLDDSKDNFDHARFYEWALSRNFTVFISSYSLPDDFAPIAIKGKRSLLAHTGGKLMQAGIYVQRKFQQQFKRDFFL